MQQYIRIDEAIKKYGKTRQTFYNYINKGILEVKKINNRLFLDTQAIENLMKTFIDNKEIETDTIESVDSNLTHVNQGIIHDQLSTIEEFLDTTFITRIEGLQNSFQQHISQVKQEILYDLKNILGVQLNHIIATQNTQLIKTEHFEDKIRSLTSNFSSFKIFEKKIYIYGGVLLFIIFQCIISIFL